MRAAERAKEEGAADRSGSVGDAVVDCRDRLRGEGWWRGKRETGSSRRVTLWVEWKWGVVAEWRRWMKIERGAVRFWRRREMGLLCCRLKIERKWGEDRLRVERKMEPRLEGCGGCLGFSQGEGKGFGWLEEGTTGDGCRSRESGRRWWNRPGEGRRRWWAAAWERKIKAPRGGGRFRFRVFFVFFFFQNSPPYWMCWKLLFISKNVTRFSNLVPQLLLFFCKFDFS
jgi:hypothetical protein